MQFRLRRRAAKFDAWLRNSFLPFTFDFADFVTEEIERIRVTLDESIISRAVDEIFREQEFRGLANSHREAVKDKLKHDVEEILTGTADARGWYYFVTSATIIFYVGSMAAAGVLLNGLYRFLEDLYERSNASNVSALSDRLTVMADMLARWWNYLPLERQAIIVLGIVCTGFIAQKFFRARPYSVAVEEKKSWHSQIEAEVTPRIRSAINEIENKRGAARLIVTRAPGLGEATAPHRIVAREEFARVHTLQSDLGANVIAVSGHRGVGKTTLLQGLCSRSGRFAMMMSAPVTYDPKEFLLHLYGGLCSKVITTSGRPRLLHGRFWRPLAHLINSSRIISRILLFLLIPYVCVAYFSATARRGTPYATWWSPATLVDLILLVAVISSAFMATRRLRASKHFGFPISLVRRAGEELRQVKYLQTVNSEQSAGLKRFGIEFGRKKTRQMAERPTTFPELVGAYRDFAEAVSRHTSGPLLICIDEVDRIAKTEEAEGFINQIKAVFGVPGCWYVVSVSEETLAGFERRAVRVRPALDSAFDEVLRLPSFYLYQSVELLRSHVVGMPDFYIAFCHCMAGGIPRDLVRAARSVVIQNRLLAPEHRGQSRSVCAAVVASEIVTLKQGILGRLTSLSGAKAPEELLLALADADDAKLSISTVNHLINTLTDGVEASEELAHTCNVLIGAMAFYITVGEVFTKRPDFIERALSSLGDETRQPAEIELDELAEVHSLLPLGGRVVPTKLDAVRSRLGLSLISAVETSSGTDYLEGGQ